MDARPDDVRDIAEHGPISPELVLVDPVLAEQARRLLPDPVEAPRRRVPVARPARTEVVPRAEPVPAPGPALPAPRLEPRAEQVPAAPRRRWRLAVALAVIVYSAGAVSGTFLSGQKTSSPGVTFEAQTGAAPAQTGPRPAQTRARPARTANQPLAPRPSATDPKTRRSPRTTTTRWASNVIGVEVRVDRPGVTLVWTPPPNSEHVVVLRARGARGRGIVIYRGRAARYRDRSARSCSAYRYTIVNYDRRGHRSTGVPTSVVTGGCT